MKITKKFFLSSQFIVIVAYLLLVVMVVANIFYLPPFYGLIEKYAFFAIVIATIVLTIEMINKK